MYCNLAPPRIGTKQYPEHLSWEGERRGREKEEGEGGGREKSGYKREVEEREKSKRGLAE